MVQIQQVFSQGNLRDQKPGVIKEMTKEEEIEILNRPHDKATSCAGAANLGAVQLQTCADVGTASFYTKGLDANATNSVATIPGIAEVCTNTVGYTTTGTWLQVNPDPGVDILDLQITAGTVANGNHSVFVQFFQGSCAALSSIGCNELVIVAMGLKIPVNVHQEGVDPTQNVWMYIWDDSGKTFNLDMEIIGSSATTITNDNCAGASNSPNGCNLGADGDNTWTGPSNNGKVCTGGTWFSNENTTYFTITAGPGVTGTISVNPINCNDGTAGQAQFAVFNSCACVGTYTAACFRSCAVGADTLSLNALTPGSTYTLVVDGQAGDICSWTFVTTGVLLPVELMSFSAKSIQGGNRIYWSTASEIGTDYFTIQRSSDGESYKEIARLSAAGNSSNETKYEYLDTDFDPGTNFYRLKQINLNGEEQYFVPSAVKNEFDGHYIYPNPVNDEALIALNSSINGTAEIQIIDATGKEIYFGSESIVKGINNLKLNTVDLKSGLYYVNISNDRESKTLKFTK